jgi:hypothetical protein
MFTRINYFALYEKKAVRFVVVLLLGNVTSLVLALLPLMKILCDYFREL